jgi:hypothetical protein
LGKFNQEEFVMKLASAVIERTLDQIEAEALPDNHPAVPQLSELFGDHTFFWTPMGSTLWSPQSLAGLCAKIGLFQSSRSVFGQASISARKPIAGESNHALSRKRRC